MFVGGRLLSIRDDDSPVRIRRTVFLQENALPRRGRLAILDDGGPAGDDLGAESCSEPAAGYPCRAKQCNVRYQPAERPSTSPSLTCDQAEQKVTLALDPATFGGVTARRAKQKHCTRNMPRHLSSFSGLSGATPDTRADAPDQCLPLAIICLVKRRVSFEFKPRPASHTDKIGVIFVSLRVQRLY